MNYVCKIASLEEVDKKYQYEMDKADIDEKDNWVVWKRQALDRYQNNQIIPYYGLLDGEIICECTAAIDSSVVQNSDNLINEKTVYLFAFRTNTEYQGQGYFSKLFKFMIEDLKSKGYEKVTLGVEPDEEKNKTIYFKYGFNEHIKNSKEVYPDGTEIEVEYYGKTL